MKTGRNDPCPCGSGKKYKVCHGTKGAHVTPHIAQKAIAIELTELPVLHGLPGLQEHAIAVAQPLDPTKRRPDNPAGSPGKYEVTFLFSRPTTAIPEREISFEPTFEGDSHIQWAMIDQGSHMRVATTFNGETIVFDLRTNKRGFLAKADAQPFDASGFQDAKDKAYRALAPTLSHWSTELDVPLQICRVFSMELATQSRMVTYQLPFADVTFSPASIGRVSEDLRFYLSLYREGLISNSPAYQFLCFYKIVEGIRLRRKRLPEAMAQAGGKPSRNSERIPEKEEDLSTWLNSLFRVKGRWDNVALSWIVPQEARGKKVGHLFETSFTPIRNHIAHALTNSGEPRHTADEQLNPLELEKCLPLVRCVARWMLKNEFPGEFLVGA